MGRRLVSGPNHDIGVAARGELFSFISTLAADQLDHRRGNGRRFVDRDRTRGGFADSAHLTQTHKRMFGIEPTAVRPQPFPSPM